MVVIFNHHMPQRLRLQPADLEMGDLSIPQYPQLSGPVNADPPPEYSTSTLPTYSKFSHHVDDDRPVRSLRGTYYRATVEASFLATSTIPSSMPARTPSRNASEGQRPPEATEKRRTFVLFKYVADKIGRVGAAILILMLSVLGLCAVSLVCMCIFDVASYGTDRSDWPGWIFG